MRVALLALLVLALPAPAAAQQTLPATGTIGEAARALATDPVYVDPRAEDTVSQAEGDRLRERISARGAGPMYIAVLPETALDEAGGDPGQVLTGIGRRLDRGGTYVLVAGDAFRAGATKGVLERGRASELADEAFAARRSDGAGAVLADFIDRVGAERRDGGGGGDGAGGSGSGLLVLLAALAGGFGLVALLRGRRRRREQAAQVAELREVANDDLVALGDDIRALDLDVEMPDADPVGRERYATALGAYERADAGLKTARTPEDFAPIGDALEEGRWAMESAKALLAGRPEVERRPPCFFDPRHGPSTRDVEWAPTGGQPRPVPACEADALRVESGEEPSSRELTVGGRSMPYWQAPAYYSPLYAGGMFGGFGGFLPGLLFGSMLGGPFFGGMGGFGGVEDPGAGGGFGGGDFGGGFGGGDFGGGGFGGGDFGGGDF